MKSFQESVSRRSRWRVRETQGSEISSRGNGQTKRVEFLPSEVAAIIIHYDLSNYLMNENSSSYLKKSTYAESDDIIWIKWLSFFLRITICGVSRFKPSSRCCKENQGQTPPPGLLPRSVAAVVVVSGSVGYGSSGNNVFEGFDGNQKSGKLRRLAIFLPLFTGFP